jgi:hypothetical protein
MQWLMDVLKNVMIVANQAIFSSAATISQQCPILKDTANILDAPKENIKGK